MADLNEFDVFCKTIYAEARGEPLEGQQWVAWVIKNRAGQTEQRLTGVGHTIRGVCLGIKINSKPGTVYRLDIAINEPGVYNEIRRWARQIYDAPASADPTGGADHYNNPIPSKGRPPSLDSFEL